MTIPVARVWIELGPQRLQSSSENAISIMVEWSLVLRERSNWPPSLFP
jgi:hypothetical protein